MTAALLAALLLPAAPPDPPPIAQFLPPAAWGVWFADLDRWTPAAFDAADNYLKTAGGPLAGDDWITTEFRALQTDLAAAGATGLYAPLDPLKLGASDVPPAVILCGPNADPDRVRAAVEAAKNGAGDPLFPRPVSVETRGGATAVLCGLDPWPAAADRPALAAALAATGGAAMGVVYAPTADQRGGLRQLLPPGGPLPAGLAASAEWAALVFDPAKDEPVRMIAEAATPADADALAALPKTLATQYADALPPGAAALAADLTPAVDGTRGTLTVSADVLSRTFAAFELSGPAQSSARSRSQNNLKQIALAMHNFHSTYSSFPPTGSYADDGKPLLSWRVHLLPWLDNDDLYKKFKLDEPWDSAHNKALLKEMPEVFASPRAETEPGMTVYQVPFGPGLPFEGQAGKPLSEFRDGTTQTILAVEAAEAVPWTKPADWSPDVSENANPFPGLFAAPDGSALVGMADGSVHTYRAADLKPATLRKLLTPQGGEVVGSDEYR